MSTQSVWVWIAVAAAGSLGAMLRFWLGRVIGAWQKRRTVLRPAPGNPVLLPSFPLGVLAANTLACLFIGTTAGQTGLLPLLIATGLCGGLSTMSTLAVGALTLWNDGPRLRTVLYLALTLVAGLIALWLGRGAAQLLAG